MIEASKFIPEKEEFILQLFCIANLQNTKFNCSLLPEDKASKIMSITFVQIITNLYSPKLVWFSHTSTASAKVEDLLWYSI